MDIQKAFDKAKITLMSSKDSVFFTTICFSLKHEFTDKVPTAGTDGRSIFINPTFFMGLNTAEQVFLLLHETLHVAYMHVEATRRGTRDFKKWNVAADYVINEQLVSRNYKMPKNGLYNPAYKDMAVEEVFDLLPEPPQDFQPDIVESSDEDGKLQAEIQDILVAASLQSKMGNDSPGAIPGEIQIALTKLLDPKLPWQSILRKYLFAYNRNDYTYKKPNRRFFPEHYLPSMHSQNLMDLTIAIDTSGSVSDEQFTGFISEIASIFKMMNPEKITVIQFDYGIQAIDKVRSLRELQKVKFTGRGGTCLKEVFDWTTANNPRLLMVFTDGDFYDPGNAPNTDLIWLIHNNKGFTFPKGKVIHYEIPN